VYGMWQGALFVVARSDSMGSMDGTGEKTGCCVVCYRCRLES